jgi:hypothetical protein
MHQKGVRHITIHIHQFPDCSASLQHYLEEGLIFLWPSQRKQINIVWRTDTPTFLQTSRLIEKTDLYLSFGQCASLATEFDQENRKKESKTISEDVNPSSLGPGALLCPTTFFPYDMSANVLQMKEQKITSYTIENEILLHLTEIIQSKYNEQSVEYINKHYKSANTLKHLDRAQPLVSTLIAKETMLQVSSLWSPSFD